MRRLSVVVIAALCALEALAAPKQKGPAMDRAQRRAFAIPLIVGALKEQGDDDEGLINVNTAGVSQMVYWNLVKVPLEERAAYERDLMVRAAEKTASKMAVSPLAAGREHGRRAFSWGATLSSTTFRSTLVECADHHVLLTTMGKIVEDVDETHVRSMKGFECRGKKRR